MKLHLVFASIILLLGAGSSWAEGRCPPGYFPTGGGNAGWDGCAPMGGGGSDGADSGAPSMSSFSPEQWKAFFEHMEKVEAENQRERILMGQRYRQLQQGLWFMPGEVPFAGWSTGSTPSPRAENDGGQTPSSCTASFWTMDGAVTLSAPRGGEGPAVISYMGYSIPAPDRSEFRKFSLTQSGSTQSVNALISSAGRGKKPMGIVSFAVPSGNILVRAIADVQDYRLADQGRTIFSGQWHDGLKARDALAKCIAQRQ